MSVTVICTRAFLFSVVLLSCTALTFSQRTEISKVEADLVGGYLYVTGENFDRRERLTLKLAGEPLSILVKTEVQLIAALPSATQPGTYRLVLHKNRGNDLLDSLDVTIGAVGPAGPEGPQGQQGPAGSNGQPGLQGEAGAQGSQGETGKAGSQGPQGEAGPQGAAGPAGPQGQTGPQGPQGFAGASGPQGNPGITVAVVPIGRAPQESTEAITQNDSFSSFICSGQSLGQATIDPSWFGASSVQYRFVVLGSKTAGGSGEDLLFELCRASSLSNADGTLLSTNTISSGTQLADSGWQTLEGTTPVRLNLRARKRPAAAGGLSHAYVLIRPAPLAF